jgi:hypothetical protein
MKDGVTSVGIDTVEFKNADRHKNWPKLCEQQIVVST